MHGNEPKGLGYFLADADGTGGRTDRAATRNHPPLSTLIRGQNFLSLHRAAFSPENQSRAFPQTIAPGIARGPLMNRASGGIIRS